ncbi:MAG: DUF5606 domain-containing protein [Bacteroidales bacterium]|nr:DUF5606 domain-containing protein [Bacteroidales bacterium]MBD5287917.1 DUF5606 domain-containing protein [Bacteroides sp.]MBD5386281.1 DUF5606 domain-containing protein [bacterium]
MLRTILSVTGRPGLFKIVSQGKGVLIVEELGTGKRFPIHARDKVSSLGDIAMYTESGDTPLGEILDKVYAKHNGEKIDVKALVKNDGLKGAFEEVVEDYDRDRVYNNDIKKLFSWYNILIDNGFTKFTEDEKKEEEKSEEEQK